MSNANLIILLSTISTGLILGAIFSLVAVGVTIVYGSIWMPNAAKKSSRKMAKDNATATAVNM